MLKRRKLLSVILALCMIVGSYSKAPAVYASETETTKIVAAESAESMEASMEAIAEEITKALEEVDEAGVTEYLNSSEEETEEPTSPETKEQATQAPETQAPETEATDAPGTVTPAAETTSEDTVQETAEPAAEADTPAEEMTDKDTEAEEPKAEEPEDTKAEEPKAEEPEDTKAEEPKAEEPEDTQAEEPEDTQAEEPEQTQAEEPEEPQTEEPEAPEVKMVLYSAYLEQVTVSVTAREDAFDEDVKLVVKPLDAASDAYKDAEAALAAEGKTYDGMMAFDIGFVSTATGAEVEPASPVTVKMMVNKAALTGLNVNTVDTDSMTVTHITEDAVVDVADAADETDGQVTVFASEEEMKSIKAEFEVDGFSTYTITWTEDGDEKTATVHWGIDEEDGFKELATPTSIDSTASSVDVEVIIDAEKYYFIGADYRLTEGAETFENLKSTVLHNVDGVWQVALEDSGTVPLADGSHIYVHYAPYSEAEPYSPPAPPTPEVLSPETNKNVEYNGDGTYTIRLDIEGKSDHSTNVTAANVVVIMDITQSMTNSMSGGGTRMAAAKNALNTLINTLDPDTNTIYFRAINFGDNRNPYDARSWTTETSEMQSYVSGLPNNPNDMGTCWQAGLRGGYNIVTQEVPNNADLAGNATYVVFVTDGNPNCYAANNDGTGNWTGASGPNYNATAYNRAAYWANQLGPVCEFYGVYCGNSNDSGLGYLRQLITAANGSDENFIDGTSASSIESAFANIAQTIVNNLGAGGVTVDDGIPTLSNVSANVSAGEAGGFKYYITPAGESEREWVKGATGTDDKGAPGASYSNSNGVTWDLGEAGELKNGWIYSLEFTVWPSQAAYDLIADLNNGLIDFDDLTEEQQASIDGSKETGYTLKTNTHLYTTFTDLNGKTYQDTTDARPSAMELPTTTLTIIKDWNNEMDAREATDVTLTVTKDGEPYKDVVMGEPVKTGEHTWRQSPEEEIYISYGQIIKGEVEETGHEYTVIEPENFSYRWDLTADIYRPMIIEGVKKVLVLTDDPTGTEGTDYYTIDGKTYQVTNNNQNVLSATNDRRSNLIINKAVTGTGAPADAVFGFEITLDDVKGNHPGDEAYSDWYDTIWFAVQTDPADRDTVVKEGITVEGATPEDGDTGFYWFDNGGTVTVYIHAGEYIVFTNVARDAEYTVTELLGEEMPDGFQFVDATSAADNKAGGESTPAEISDNVAEGTIDQSNTDYSVTYNNKYEKIDIEFTKEWVDEDDQDGIRPSAEDFAKYLTLKANGEALEGDDAPTPEIEDKEDGTYTITYTGIPKYIDGKEAKYTLEERTIEGYTTTGSPADVDGTITNTHKVETMDITATKAWDDANDQDGKRDNVTLVLVANGTEVPDSGKTISKTASGDALTVKWEKVPINANGAPITYSVKEDGESGGKITMNGAEYTVTYGGNAEEGFTVTNKHEPETEEIEVTKIWEDASNQDGKRPATVAFTVTGSDGKTYEVTMDGTGNTWTKTVEVVKYAEGQVGQEVTFTVDEAAVTGYTKSIDNSKLTITNTYTPETDTITVTKIWDDASDQDGKRPETVAFTVTGSDGNEYPVTLKAGETASDTWTAEVEVQKYYDGGKEVTFTVDEAAVTGYEKEIDNDTLTITNSYTPETEEIEVTKIWADANDQDGKRPATVAFTVTGSDGKTYEVTMNGTGNTWTKTVEVQKYYNGGQEVAFTVDEAAVTGYTKSIDNSKLTITNTYTPETDTITVTKIWDDASDQDGKRPETVAFTVTGSDGNEYPVTLKAGETASDTWTAEVEVQKYYDGGKEVTFTVDEAAVTGYEKEIDNDNLTITNSYTPETEEIEVTKIWDDADDQDGKRPETVAFTVTGSDEKTYDVTLEAGEEGGSTWTAKVTVDKYYNGGQEVTFEVDEATVEGYEKSIDNSKLTITNTYTPETDTITVTKIWDDASDQDGKRPETVAFTVTGSDGNEYPVTLKAGETASDTWTAEVEVQKYYDGGQEVTFTVDEAAVTGYEKEIDNDNLTITNSYTPETEEIEVTKIWDDADDQDGKRPETVAFTVTGSDEKTYDVTLEAGEEGGNTWTAKVTVDKYYNGGQEVTFEVDEATVEGYEKEIDNDNLTITNTYTPETDTITVTKIWDDASDQDGKRPETVAFTVTGSDGNEYPVTLKAGETASDTWTAEVEVQKYYDGGQEVTFTVDEAAVTGYEKEIDNENLTITNSYTPEKTKITVTKIWDDASDQDGIRPDKVKFTVTGSDEKTYEAEFDGTGDTWTKEIEVDKYFNHGEEVSFSVDEDEVANYEKKIDNSKLTITNSYTPETTQIDVVKEWEDSDTTELRPEDISVTIVGVVGEKEVYRQAKNLKADASGDWKATWSDLDVYYGGGNEIEYSAEEAAIENYTAEIGELEETDTGYQIVITNTHDTGDLSVSKEVISPAESDHEKAFEIKITLSPAVTGEFEATGVEGTTSVSFDDGEATVNLKDGETLTIKGLPTTVEATVTETNPGSQYKTPVLDPAAGKVTISDEAEEVEITNERKVGDLKLNKTVVSSTNADHQKTFNFTITLTGEEGATVNGDFEATGVEGIETVTFTNGAATAALKDGQTLTIKGLPVGVSYEVTEEEADQGGFVTTKSDDTGDIKESAPADVKFTNTRSEGSLVVAKKVVSKLPADVDPEQTKFTITITLDDTTISNTYSGVEFTDGVATVELGHGETKTIEGLPADMGYTVSEEAPENFEEPEIDGAEGTIAKDETKKAEVTNTRKVGDLTITKTVESVFAADKEKTFEFTITLDPAIEATFDTVDGEGTEGTITFNEKGVATVTLKDGEEITIKGLPVTVSYTVEETEDPEFKTTQTGDSGEITAAAAAETEGEPETEGETEDEGTKAEFTNERKLVEVSVEKVWEDEDNKYEKQPESITVVLLADKKPYKDEEGNEVTAELNADNEWKYTFENLPEVVGKKTVEYTVDEVMEDENGEPLFPGYTKEITGSAEKGFTITNTFKPVDTDPPVGKVVIGDKPADPETFKFTFKATSSDPEPPMPEQTEIEIVGEGMEEFGQFWFTEPGTYEYEIAEVKEDAEGYTYDSTVYKLKYEITVGKDNELVKKMYVNGKEVKEFEQDTIQFENKYTMPKVKITVNKTWEDNDDEWSIRPASIKVEVKGNGEVVKTVLLTEMDGWTKTIKGLPKYDDDGEEIKYTIEEAKVAGYESEAGDPVEEEDGVFTVELTNKLKDFEPVDKVITVKKNVENGPKKVSTYKFELEAVGDAPVPEGVKNGTFTIKGDGSTQLKFTFDEPGTYTYKLKEVNTGEKDCTYDKAEYKLVFKVTLNTKTSKLEAKLAMTKGSKTVEGTKVTFTNSYLVKTGDDTNMTPWVVAMATSATIAGTGAVILKKRRKEEEEA